jgi:hypothetical protein
MSGFSAANSNSLFAAINLKNFKDDYSGNFAEILEKVQSGVVFFWHFLDDNMSRLFF